MKLTSNSTGRPPENHGSAIELFSLSQTATTGRRMAALDITRCPTPDRARDV